MDGDWVSIGFTYAFVAYFSESLRIRFSHAYVLYTRVYYRYYNYIEVNFITLVAQEIVTFNPSFSSARVRVFSIIGKYTVYRA